MVKFMLCAKAMFKEKFTALNVHIKKDWNLIM